MDRAAEHEAREAVNVCGDYVFLESRSAGVRELAALYRQLAYECVRSQARGALVKLAPARDYSAHLSLRDALATMVLAGIPTGFRLALVTGDAEAAAAFASVSRDCAAMQIHVKVFGQDTVARNWLAVSA
jgi:hypothetical protein